MGSCNYFINISCVKNNLYLDGGDWTDSCFCSFTSKEEPPVATGHVTWTSETVWTLHGKENSVGLAGVEHLPFVNKLMEVVLIVAYKT